MVGYDHAGGDQRPRDGGCFQYIFAKLSFVLKKLEERLDSCGEVH
jgi:hypothetical protein